jgi:DNA-binding CsgD family transcriptional regulator
MPENEDTFPDGTSFVRRRALHAPTALFALTAVLMSVDAAADLAAGSTEWHVGLEVVLAVLSGVGAAILLRELQHERRLRAVQTRQLQAASEDAQRWQQAAADWRGRYEETLVGLGAAIDEQFSAWELTPAESEVCLLLLKGLSFKEIATVRGAGERTVRQQANAAYKKAGLGGRAELSAFFLEDLLLPAPPPARASGPSQVSADRHAS